MGGADMAGSALGGFADGLNWVQTLPPPAKMGASVVVVVLAATLLFLLWQKPRLTPEEHAPQPVSIGPVTQQKVGSGAAAVQSGSGNQQTTFSGSHNVNAPQQQEIKAPVTQSGPVSSTGQTGGQTAGIIFNQAPPVTEQQKQQALASLQAQLEELANFPGSAELKPPPDILEQHVLDKSPTRLFELASGYYRETIRAVPTVGEQLYTFKTEFYQFRESETATEQAVLNRIGGMVEVRFPAGWAMYLRYFVMRAGGLSQKQIEGFGNFLNYSITWDETERVYAELAKDERLMAEMTSHFARYGHLTASATAILGHLKG